MTDRTPSNRVVGWVVSQWKRPIIRRSFQACWIGVVFLFVSLAVAGSWEELREIAWTPRLAGLLVFAFLAALIRRLAGGLLWAALICAIRPGRKISIIQTLRNYFISNLATYLPGSYWNVPSLIVLHKRQGLTTLETGTALILFHVLVLLSAGLLGMIGFEFMAKALHLPEMTFGVYLAAVTAGLVLIHPAVFNGMTRRISGMFKRTTAKVKIPYGKMIVLLALAVVIWLLGAASLLFQAHAMTSAIPLTVHQVGIFGAIFAVSWLAGFFTPFAPNGLGVREGVMGASLVLLGVSVEMGIVIAALSRIIIVLEDVFWGGISLIKERRIPGRGRD